MSLFQDTSEALASLDGVDVVNASVVPGPPPELREQLVINVSSHSISAESDPTRILAYAQSAAREIVRKLQESGSVSLPTTISFVQTGEDGPIRLYSVSLEPEAIDAIAAGGSITDVPTREFSAVRAVEEAIESLRRRGRVRS